MRRRQVLFTPHLAPLNRGILATCYARPAGDVDDRAQLLARCPVSYHDEPFVVVGRALAVDEGDARHATRPTHGALRRAHRHGHRDLRDRQPRQGCLAAARCRPPTSPSASTRPRACSRSVCTRDVDAASDASVRRRRRCGPRRSSRRCRTSAASPARSSSSSTAATRSPAPRTTTRSALFAQDIVLMRRSGCAPSSCTAAARRSAT